MKKLILIAILITTGISMNASELFLLQTGSLEKTKAFFNKKEYTVHFYNDNYIIATAEGKSPEGSLIIDTDAWSEKGSEYFLLYFNPLEKNQYIATIEATATILLEQQDYLVVTASEQQARKLIPAVHSGIVRISRNKARFPEKSFSYHPGSLQPRNYISDMLSQVNQDTLQAFVQHLQDFGTRNAYKAGGILAQNWILSKFQSYGLEAELHDFWMPGGAASDNVIATLTGTVHPDEYVVLGAHYDSYTGGASEPGADDNATGAAGILEAARIMSQYQFDRTIIFATWSGEEYGLYGSEAWANEAADNGMNILGYFNIDMAGYLYGDTIHTDIIAPAPANELRQFYKNVCAIYLPEFKTANGSLSGGDSDHTSFNNAGYQGIFPFEDVQHYSPYIHTANDLIGPSVTSFAMHKTFVQAVIANVVTMSDQLPSPENLVAVGGDMKVDLSWNAAEDADYYTIYRNNDSIALVTTSETSYTDVSVENMVTYTYYVTANFTDSGEESGPSNIVTVTPLPPITLPFFDDFETGGLFWVREGSWGLQDGVYYSASNSMTESPDGEYESNLEISSSLRPVDLTGAATAQVSFWTKYVIESGWDFMYLDVSVAGLDWEQLDAFTGELPDWTLKTYSLNDYTGQSNVIIRFRFVSDGWVQEEGMNIDDLEIMIGGIGIGEGSDCQEKTTIFLNPNPVSSNLQITYWIENSGPAKITFCDLTGAILAAPFNGWQTEGRHDLNFDVSRFPDGMYYGILETGGKKITRKIIIQH